MAKMLLSLFIFIAVVIAFYLGTGYQEQKQIEEAAVSATVVDK